MGQRVNAEIGRMDPDKSDLVDLVSDPSYEMSQRMVVNVHFI